MTLPTNLWTWTRSKSPNTEALHLRDHQQNLIAVTYPIDQHGNRWMLIPTGPAAEWVKHLPNPLNTFTNLETTMTQGKARLAQAAQLAGALTKPEDTTVHIIGRIHTGLDLLSAIENEMRTTLQHQYQSGTITPLPEDTDQSPSHQVDTIHRSQIIEQLINNSDSGLEEATIAVASIFAKAGQYLAENKQLSDPLQN